MWSYLITPFKKYLDFINGRASRMEYWCFSFCIFFIWIIFCLVFSPFLSPANLHDPLLFFYPLSYHFNYPPLLIIFIILLRIFSLAVEFRRLHDIGYGGIYTFLGLLLGYPILVAFLCIGFSTYGVFLTKLELLIILRYPIQLLKYPLQFTIIGGPIFLLLMGVKELRFGGGLGYCPFISSIITLLAYLYLFTKKSQPGKNKWGQNPDVVILTEYEIERQKNSQSQQSLEK